MVLMISFPEAMSLGGADTSYLESSFLLSIKAILLSFTSIRLIISAFRRNKNKSKLKSFQTGITASVTHLKAAKRFENVTVNLVHFLTILDSYIPCLAALLGTTLNHVHVLRQHFGVVAHHVFLSSASRSCQYRAFDAPQLGQGILIILN